jgi:2-methylfumaryl-CoA isomerase
MTLAQMGAEVIRFDRLEGGLDHHRWPVAESGQQPFLGRAEQGQALLRVDMKSPEGRELVSEIICAPGPDAGLFI